VRCGRTDGSRGLRWTDRGEYSGLSATENVQENEASAGRNECSLSGLVSKAQVGFQNRPLLFCDQKRNRRISTPDTSMGCPFVLIRDEKGEGVQMMSPGRPGISYPVPCRPSVHYIYHRFNTHKFYVLPTRLYLCVLCVSQNKQRLFPYTTLTDWFV
jgi:hypothetical protein